MPRREWTSRVLGELRGKDVLLGVVDVGTEDVETPEVVADRIRRALPYVAPERLKPCTDCGLVPRSRAAALGKMRALAEGAALVAREVAGAPRRGDDLNGAGRAARRMGSGERTLSVALSVTTRHPIS